MLLSRLFILAAMWGGIVSARVIEVPGEAPTVQAGLDNLADGDTVLVAIGVYAEALIAPPLHFALRGDVEVDTGDYSRPLMDPSSLPGSDSLACLVLPAGSHPVIEHFRFRNGPEMFPRVPGGHYGGIVSSAMDVRMTGCQIDSTYVGFKQIPDAGVITLEQCQFRNDTAACLSGTWAVWHAEDCFFSARAFMVVSFAAPGSSFMRCHFGESHSVGGYLLHAIGDSTVIEDCVFGPDHSSYAMLDMNHGTARISNNLFVDSRTMYAIAVELSDGNPVVIEDNVLHHLRYDDILLTLDGVYLHWDEGSGTGRLVEVRNNIFTDLTGYAHRAKAIYSIRAGANVIANRFYDLDHDSLPAVALDSGDDDFLVLRENLFWTTGLAVRGDTYVDARWNWWGDSTGPYHETRNPFGQGDTVDGDLQFEPWYPDSSFLSVRGIHTPLPETFELSAYPNPFNSSVTLTLVPSQVAIVRVELFDILGRRVQEIWSGPLAFEKRMTFDGAHLASGIYFVRVWQPIGNRPLAMQKIVLLR